MESEHAKARGAKIYAEVFGNLSYNEADHAMRNGYNWEKAASGIKKLIQISKRNLDDVDYFCGHGHCYLHK